MRALDKAKQICLRPDEQATGWWGSQALHVFQSDKTPLFPKVISVPSDNVTRLHTMLARAISDSLEFSPIRVGKQNSNLSETFEWI